MKTLNNTCDKITHLTDLAVASGTDAECDIAAATGHMWTIDSISGAYDEAPTTTSKLQIIDVTNSNAILWQVRVTAAGPFHFTWPSGFQCTLNSAIKVKLEDGTVESDLNVSYR